MEELKEAVNLALKLYKESDISLYEAADKAAELIGYDERATMPIYLLIKNSESEITAWADSF